MEQSLHHIKGVEFWVLLVIANKNYGQPFVQYAERRYLALFNRSLVPPWKKQISAEGKNSHTKSSPKQVWWGGAILNV